MKKSIVFAVAALLLLPMEGNAQKWLKNLGKVAKEVEKVLDSTPSSTDTASSGTAESSSTNNATGEYQKGGFKIVTNHPDLVIKLRRCKVSGKTCVIDLLVSNVGDKDVSVNFNGGNNDSFAFDDEGNQYDKGLFSTTIGNRNLSTYTTNIFPLPANSPVKARIQIEGVAEEATLFTRIQLNVVSEEFRIGWYHKKYVTFYNVPITRDGDE